MWFKEVNCEWSAWLLLPPVYDMHARAGHAQFIAPASYLMRQCQLSEQLVAPDSVFTHPEYPPSFGYTLPSSDVIESGGVGRTCLPLYPPSIITILASMLPYDHVSWLMSINRFVSSWLSRPRLDPVHVLKLRLTGCLSCPGMVGLTFQGEQQYKGCSSLCAW